MYFTCKRSIYMKKTFVYMQSFICSYFLFFYGSHFYGSQIFAIVFVDFLIIIWTVTQLLYMYFYSRRPATKYFISITGACCTVTTYLIFYLYSRCLVTIPILATTCSISSTGVTRISEMFAKISTLLGLATRMGKLRKVHTVPKKKT